MKHSLQSITRQAVSLTIALSMAGMGSVMPAFARDALHLTSASATLTDNRSVVASDYTFGFDVASTTSIKGIRIQFRIAPSGTSTPPAGLDTTSADLTGALNDEITINGTPTAGWTIGVGTPGQIDITKAGGTGALVAKDPLVITLTNITNPDATTAGGDQCDAIANSETCYAIITTYDTDVTADFSSTTILDTGVVSYTSITPVTVTATVDPQLKFTVAGVTSLANVNSNDANASCANGDVVATATTIPFGNIRVNTPKCGQQSLAVLTNAEQGYKVYHKFVGTIEATDMMKGTNTSNNFDKFTGNASTWGTPAAWASPTGATNVSSGWVGARVKNPGTMSPAVSGFGTSNFYAPPYTGTDIGNLVMDQSGPDNGASPTYVTFKIEAGANQPADTYTGTMVYNVVATY